MLAIRLTRTGSKKRPMFRVVVTEQKTARDGRCLEILGRYDPRLKPAAVEVDIDRVQHWVKAGAQVSDTVRTLLAKHMTKNLAAQPPVEATAPAEQPAS